ncbi:MAG: SURF1 family protein [Nocardioidaceae bacterium]|nr:SURF1 family protein [Nocardioidaceae bacterium]
MRSSLASWRFLVSRRWILFFLAVILLGWGTWWLGEWQFGRLEDRKQHNAVVRANESRAAAPVESVLAPGRPVADRDEWRLITATGTYDVTNTVVVRYRARDSAPGVEVVVPLVTSDGTALIVDRGWFGTDNPQIKHEDLPDAPQGEVKITGWVRSDGSGDSVAVDDHSTRAISSKEIGSAIGQPVFTGFVALKSEDPSPQDPLEPVELPDLGEGPHFFYGLQWWFFGVLGLGGFGYLAWDERQRGPRGERAGSNRRSRGPFSRRDPEDRPPYRRPRNDESQSDGDTPPSTGTIAPERKDAAGESRNAATRPNSAGSP